MHRNEVKGAGKEILGSMKQTAGRLTNRPGLEMKGAAQKLAGKIQKGVGRLQDSARKQGYGSVVYDP